MGIFGTGIFDDDIALDVQDCWEEQIAKGATAEQATRRVVNKLGDRFSGSEHDESVFWIALAALQVEARAVEPHVSDLVRRWFPRNLEWWKEVGASDEDLAERAEVLRVLESNLEPNERPLVQTSTTSIAAATTDEWQAFHFSQENPQGEGQDDVPALLRRVADAVAELGDVRVMDVVFRSESTGEGEWPSMTVYYVRPGAQP